MLKGRLHVESGSYVQVTKSVVDPSGLHVRRLYARKANCLLACAFRLDRQEHCRWILQRAVIRN